jgi:hypothetical protein
MQIAIGMVDAASEDAQGHSAARVSPRLPDCQSYQENERGRGHDDENSRRLGDLASAIAIRRQSARAAIFLNVITSNLISFYVELESLDEAGLGLGLLDLCEIQRDTHTIHQHYALID